MSKAQLRIPDLDSEVRDPGFKGWVPLLNYNFGPTSNSPIGAATGGQGRPARNSDVALGKEMDALTPVLYARVSSGQPVSEVVIVLEGLSPGSAYAVLVFSNVTFTNLQMGGNSEGGTPLESVTISFQKLEYMSLVQYLAVRGAAAALNTLASWFK